MQFFLSETHQSHIFEMESIHHSILHCHKGTSKKLMILAVIHLLNIDKTNVVLWKLMKQFQ